jgi:hypothetical protein
MRHLLLASVLLAACQPDEPTNIVPAKSEGVVANLESDVPDAVPGDSDRPVASDDPRPVPPADPNGPSPDCPIIRSSDWHARVDAMPGPNDNPRLIISGKVTVPTGGYRLALRMGTVAESYPVQVAVHLDATPPSEPATQAIEIRDVRGSWPSEERVGSVTIRCGSRTLARLANIETAR